MAYSYTGRRLIADILEDITGLTEWVDYFPVQYDETTDTATKAGAAIITDEGGTGDNFPVYLVTGRTQPWVCNATGYVPIIDAPAPPAVAPSLLSHVATYDGVNSPAAVTHSVKLPAHSNGDLLVVVHSVINSNNTTTPATWNKWDNTAVWPTVSTRRTTIFWKIATADSAATTVSITTPSSHRAQSISFVIAAGTFDAATPLEATLAAGYLDAGLSGATSLVPGSVTPSWGGSNTLWIPFVFHQPSLANHKLRVPGETYASYIQSTTASSFLGVSFYSTEDSVATLTPTAFEAYVPPDTLRSAIMCGATIAIKPA